MAWTCFSCLNCDTTGATVPEVCPGCGHPVDEWAGSCPDCPNQEACRESRA